MLWSVELSLKTRTHEKNRRREPALQISLSSDFYTRAMVGVSIHSNNKIKIQDIFDSKVFRSQDKESYKARKTLNASGFLMFLLDKPALDVLTTSEEFSRKFFCAATA